MKKTLSTGQAADILSGNPENGFSYTGARALIEYLEEIEKDTGEEMELDCVAIRGDFSEYSSLQEWAEDYFSDDWRSELGLDDDADDDDTDDAIRAYIQDSGTLIEFSGGVIVSSF